MLGLTRWNCQIVVNQSIDYRKDSMIESSVENPADAYIGSATYSPEDNKLRFYPASRLPRFTYDRVRLAGFIWAPKQELFVAPTWTPERDDLLIELCGEIGDEDTSLVERAEQRADRFEEYRDHRAKDAEQARKAVDAIAQNIPLGQPILVGHHSEARARRDCEKINTGMRKSIRLWDQSNYWQARAQGALRAAKYKESPDVRTRRIKKLEADQRRSQRQWQQAHDLLALWTSPGLTIETAKSFTGLTEAGYLRLPRKEGDTAPPEFQPNAYDVLGRDEPSSWWVPRSLEEVIEQAHKSYTHTMAYCDRWINHYEMRLAYERAMLATPKPSSPPCPATTA